MGDLIRNISDLPVRDRVQITATGMRIEGPLDYDEWLNLMSGLQRIGGAWQWAVGDGLVHGELKWGERYAQAVAVAEEVGLSPSTIQQLQWLCDRVPYHVRQPSLGISHHRQVATLDVEEQERILRACAENGATVNDVKEAVKRYKALQSGKPDPGPRDYADEEKSTGEMFTRVNNDNRESHRSQEPTADHPPDPTTETRTGPVEEAPEEEEDVYGEVDMLAELEAAHARAERAEEIVRELARDDDAQAVIEWRDKYHRLRGRLQDVQRSYHEERKAREWQTDLLQKIRAFLGVQRSSQIMDALRKRRSG